MLETLARAVFGEVMKAAPAVVFGILKDAGLLTADATPDKIKSVGELMAVNPLDRVARPGWKRPGGDPYGKP